MDSVDRLKAISSAKKDLEFINDKLAFIREDNEEYARMDIKAQADFARYSETRYYIVKTLDYLCSMD